MGIRSKDELHKNVIERLETVYDERLGHSKNIVDAKVVSSIRIIDDGHVIILLSVNPEDSNALEELRQRVEKEVLSIPSVSKVNAVLTAEKSKVTSDSRPVVKNPPLDLPVKHIIAVASGKGGVGKSTVAANIAVSLANTYGMRTGLLDADIYGPSQPLMMGNEGYKPVFNEDKKMVPAENYGVKIMSIGFMVDASKALAWRGPMAQSAFYQLLRDVNWADDGEELDFLVVDLPPGTGDIHITMAQKLKVSGAVIVSTPQDISLIDVRRAVEMFDKTDISVLGIIENMSTYICPNCGHEEHIFGYGGARTEAGKLGIEFLGDIPLSRNIRECSDHGKPVVLNEPDSKAAGNINGIVARIIDTLV